MATLKYIFVGCLLGLLPWNTFAQESVYNCDGGLEYSFDQLCLGDERPSCPNGLDKYICTTKPLAEEKMAEQDFTTSTQGIIEFNRTDLCPRCARGSSPEKFLQVNLGTFAMTLIINNDSIAQPCSNLSDTAISDKIHSGRRSVTFNNANLWAEIIVPDREPIGNSSTYYSANDPVYNCGSGNKYSLKKLCPRTPCKPKTSSNETSTQTCSLNCTNELDKYVCPATANAAAQLASTASSEMRMIMGFNGCSTCDPVIADKVIYAEFPVFRLALILRNTTEIRTNPSIESELVDVYNLPCENTREKACKRVSISHPNYWVLLDIFRL